MEKNAYELLLQNARQGKTSEGKEYFYICPAPGKYPHQWLWDSCFHAIVMKHFNVELAEKEMITLLSMVQEDGFLPCTIFWDANFFVRFFNNFLYSSKYFNRITQPPVVGISLEKIYSKTKNKQFLERTLPLAKKYYLWLMKKRDIDNDGLVSVIHPFETGADECIVFDKIYGLKNPTTLTIYYYLLKNLRQCKRLDWDLEKISKEEVFNVESVGFNCIYAQGLRSLSRLFSEVDNDKDARFFNKKANATEKVIFEKCYDNVNDIFLDLAFRDKLKVPVVSFFSLMPLILDNIDPVIADFVVKEHLLNPKEFWSPYPIPSVSMSDPSFSSSGTTLLWRGPTWINVNWFIFNGLKKHGYHDVAKEILKKTIELVAKSGFREFYNPFTGEGMRTKDYGWSTLIVDMIKDISKSD
ncbi:hypothetical protein DRJ22_04825 [Candidatus Woesearchaeota archaeon]|nr:MAG: hypothetical protein DRJ22_04825 [Candidatus Woesearchaeota archaeon]